MLFGNAKDFDLLQPTVLHLDNVTAQSHYILM